jgi:hypothetical protein
MGFVDEPRHAVEMADALVIMVDKGVAEDARLTSDGTPPAIPAPVIRSV